MITIRKFEQALAPHLQISGPALDQRNRALRQAGMILKSDGDVAPRGKGGISVNASDAAWVLLAAASDAGPKDVVEVVQRMGKAQPSATMKDEKLDDEGEPISGYPYWPEGLPDDFRTAHGALSCIIGRGTEVGVHEIVVRPHTYSVEMDLSFNLGGEWVNRSVNYGDWGMHFGARKTPTDMRIAFEIQSPFINFVQNLVEFGKGDVVRLVDPSEMPSFT